MDKSSAQFEDGANVMLCHDALSKQWVAARLAGQAGKNAHYLDLDMLYSGYLEAGLAERRGRVISPGPAELRASLVNAVEAAAAGRTVVLDSLNGLCTESGPEPGMLAGSYIALLSMAARSAGSKAFVMAVARESGGGWVLRPGGTRVPEVGAAFFVDAGRRVGKLDGAADRI